MTQTLTVEQTAMETLMSQVGEIHDRARRMETQLHKIREHIGMPEFEVPQSVTVDDPSNIELQGYDTTLSRIKRELNSAGVFQIETPVTVWLKNKEQAVAEIIFLE